MEIGTTFAVAVPVVIGLVQLLKEAGFPSRFAGLLSLVLGVTGAWIIGGTPADITLQGLMIGLTASGLYSATRSTLGQ